MKTATDKALMARLAMIGAASIMASLRAEYPDEVLQIREPGEPPATREPARKPKTAKRLRRPMTKAEKRAVSARMKRYWSERRKAAAKRG